MAKVHIYRVTEKGMAAGRHAFSVAGKTYKVEKNGILRLPAPGIENHEAHDLTLLAYEGDGHPAFVDPDMVQRHQNIKNAEDALKEAEGLLAEAKKGKDKDAIKEAEKLVSEAKAALAEVNKTK